MPYVANVEGHKYILSAVVQEAINGKPKLVGADIYTLKGEYKGFWPLSNMLGYIAEGLWKYVEESQPGRVPHLRVVKSESDLTDRNR
jgi:hypothetical protein